MRAGHYERNLDTKAGEVTLKVPKLRRHTFETAIIERYRRRDEVQSNLSLDIWQAQEWLQRSYQKVNKRGLLLAPRCSILCIRQQHGFDLHQSLRSNFRSALHR